MITHFVLHWETLSCCTRLEMWHTKAIGWNIVAHLGSVAGKTLSRRVWCWATGETMLDDREFGVGSDPWGDFTMEDYLEACQSCEIIVSVTSMPVLKKLLQSLHYDHRQQGSRGRALRWPVSGLLLVSGGGASRRRQVVTHCIAH